MSYSPSGLATNIQFRRQESIVVPIYKQTAGEYPYPQFTQLRDIYLSDPDIYSAINFMANRATSRGYHIQCDPKVGDHETAEEFLEEWLDFVRWGDRRNERGFKPLLRIVTREMGWGGLSLLEKVDTNFDGRIDALAQVQLTSLWKFQRNDIGNLVAIWQQPYINSRALTPDRYVMFPWNLVDRNPFGYGLSTPVAIPKVNPITGGLIPSLIAIKWQIEDDMAKGRHRYANPHVIYGAKGLSKDEGTQISDALKNPEAGDSFLTNTDVTVATDTPAGRQNWAPDLDFLDGRFKAATGNILTQMLSDKGFSYASAVKGGSLADEIIWDLQVVLQSGIEQEILMVVLEENGFDANLLKPKFLFNIPDNPLEWSIADFNTALQQGAITAEEYRRNMVKFAKWDLDPLPPMPSLNMPAVHTPGFGNQPLQPGQSKPQPGNLIRDPSGLGRLDPIARQNMAQVQPSPMQRPPR